MSEKNVLHIFQDAGKKISVFRYPRSGGRGGEFSAVLAVRRSKQGPRGSKAPTLNVIQLVYSPGLVNGELFSFAPTVKMEKR